jgi:hypothetical protein
MVIIDQNLNIYLLLLRDGALTSRNGGEPK